MDKFKPDNIPQELKGLQRWLPLNGKRCHMKEWPKKGNRFDTIANTTIQKGESAAGFIINDTGLVVLDFDKVKGDDDKLSEGAQKIIKKAHELAGQTYTENSISGKGLHMFYMAVPSDDMPYVFKIPLDDNHSKENMLEVYTGKGNAKYFAVTGDIEGECKEIANGQAVLDYLWRIAPKKKKAAAPVPDERPKNTQQDNGLKDTTHTAQDIVNLIGKIRNSKQGAKFAKLFDQGDLTEYNGDHSAADQALMNILAYRCKHDKALMKAIFDLSALAQRPKYEDRPDYVERTANTAIRDVELYSPKNNNPDVIECPEWPKTKIQGSGKNTHIVPVKEAWENTEYLLSELGIRCKLNLLSKDIEFEGRELDKLSLDTAATSIRSFAAQNGLKLTKSDTFDHIIRIARKNSYHPVRDYLNECKESWCGGDEIEKLFNCLVLQPEYEKNRAFYLKLFAKWLIGAAKIAFNEGKTSLHGVLVLQGGQGIGKTRFIYTLVPDHSWAYDGAIIQTTNKDDILRACRYWMLELGEFAATLNKDTNDKLKQFFTQSVDVLRPPYNRAMETFNRNTTFMGTINNSEFLTDPTGNRRYWTIPVQSVENTDQVDINQVWGQVMNFVDMNAPHWLTREEIQQLNIISEPFKKLTNMERLLLDKLRWDSPVECWEKVTSTDVAQRLDVPNNMVGRIGRAINSLMLSDSRVKKFTHQGGRKTYLLPLPDYMPILPHENNEGT